MRLARLLELGTGLAAEAEDNVLDDVKRAEGLASTDEGDGKVVPVVRVELDVLGAELLPR